MEKQFSTVVQPSQFIEGPRIITSVSSTALWEHTGTDGRMDTIRLESGSTHTQLPHGHRLTLPESTLRPVMVTGLEATPPTPPTPAEVTLTVYG
jgi:hypothetical protein